MNLGPSIEKEVLPPSAGGTTTSILECCLFLRPKLVGLPLPHLEFTVLGRRITPQVDPGYGDGESLYFIVPEKIANEEACSAGDSEGVWRLGRQCAHSFHRSSPKVAVLKYQECNNKERITVEWSVTATMNDEVVAVKVGDIDGGAGRLVSTTSLPLCRSRQDNCCRLEATFTNSSNWKVFHSRSGRSVIRGEYDGVDLVLPNPPKTSSTRTAAATSVVGDVNFRFAEQAVGHICEPVQPLSKPEKDYIVREAELDEELWAAAWIRAETYCEDQPYVRYIDSYKKNFAEQEFDALKRRLMGKYGQSLRCTCLVAVMKQPPQDPGANDLEKATAMQSVVGTLDLSIRQLAQGEAFPGDSIRASLSLSGFDVQRSQRYGYVSNVCVSKTARRKGIGSSLLHDAIKLARTWELKELFVHVNASNKVACRLYSKHKFQVVHAGTTEVGLNHVILLRRQL
ncbi:hypothetical protein R1sor_010832 [Riccia sorocarpa]|uniref:N-acetyltransferase domain-containing protein n=1 Tax=Riccia sorocarpa TaxID=122646 RepID=A0ABD3I0I6_9MARC